MSLREARDFIRSKTEGKVTFADVVTMMVGKPLRYLKLDGDLREYIMSFVDRISLNSHTKAAILFGSVARGDYNKYSDIDIAAITDSSFLEYFEYLNTVMRELNPIQDRLLSSSLSLILKLNVYPLICLVLRSSGNRKRDISFNFSLSSLGILSYLLINSVMLSSILWTFGGSSPTASIIAFKPISIDISSA